MNILDLGTDCFLGAPLPSLTAPLSWSGSDVVTLPHLFCLSSDSPATPSEVVSSSEAALLYYSRGFTPSPRRDPGYSGSPFLSGWNNLRFSTDEEVSRLFNSNKHLNSLSLLAGTEIVVFDIDVKSSKNNYLTDVSSKILEWIISSGYENHTSRTKSGGFHIYFKNTSGIKKSINCTMKNGVLKPFWRDIDSIVMGSSVDILTGTHMITEWPTPGYYWLKSEIPSLSSLPEFPKKFIEPVEKIQIDYRPLTSGSYPDALIEKFNGILRETLISISTNSSCRNIYNHNKFCKILFMYKDKKLTNLSFDTICDFLLESSTRSGLSLSESKDILNSCKRHVFK